MLERITIRGRILGIAAFGILIVLVVAGLSTYGLNRINKDTERFLSEIVTQMRAFRSMNEHIGFGGAIHHFKNYVLRGEQEYLLEFRRAADLGLDAVQRYRAVGGLTAEEERALDTIAEGIHAYQEMADRAENLVARGASASEIDLQVRISEKAYTDAFDTLGNVLGRDRDTDTAELLELISTIRVTQYAVGIAAVLFLSLFAGLTIRSILRPMSVLIGAVSRLEKGDLTTKAALPKGDELGDLGAAFDTMVDSIRTINKDIGEATASLNSASAEIMATIQQQTSATAEQSSAVQQITSTVEEINQSSGQVADSAKEVSAAGRVMAQSGREGLSAVEDTTNAMDAIRDQVETVARNVVALSQNTQAIGEIIATVTNIAEQSNLVALNAAIEAADARNEGRRFSVVANEMKNLADQAKAATGQVKNILEEIQRGINTTVMLTEESVKRVETGQERSDVAQNSIRQMAETIEENVTIFERIVGATGQQKIGIEQVTRGLHGIREGSQQTSAGTQQLAESARNLNSLSQQLQSMTEQFRT